MLGLWHQPSLPYLARSCSSLQYNALLTGHAQASLTDAVLVPAHRAHAHDIAVRMGSAASSQKSLHCPNAAATCRGDASPLITCRRSLAFGRVHVLSSHSSISVPTAKHLSACKGSTMPLAGLLPLPLRAAPIRILLGSSRLRQLQLSSPRLGPLRGLCSRRQTTGKVRLPVHQGVFWWLPWCPSSTPISSKASAASRGGAHCALSQAGSVWWLRGR